MPHGFFSKVAAGLTLSAAVFFSAQAIAASRSNHASAVPQPLSMGPGASLRDTVAATVSYHPTIKAFQEYRQAAEFDLQRARSGWFPRLDARAGYGLDQWSTASSRSSARGRNENAFYERSELGLVISQTIWDGMATWNRVNIGESRLGSAESRLFDNAEGLALDAVLAHIEVYRQRRIVALAELNVKNHRNILSSQHARQRSGASTMADVTQTESRLARTQASLAESRSALEVAMANYKRLTGHEVAQLEPPTPPRDAYASLEMALASSQSGNLKIQASKYDLSAAEAQTELDKAPFHPQVYLEAGPAYNWHAQGDDSYNWGNAIMLRANWNLFNGGYDWFNVKGDKARARQSRQELAALQDQLAEETTATWSQLVSAREQARFYANAVQYSTRTRDMYLEQFNVGQRSLLDVLDSENELFSSSIQLVTAQQNVIAGQYRLLAVGGALLKNFDMEQATLAVETDQDRADAAND